MSDITLNSVNWEHGMLLTPSHFLRQEKYSEALNLWSIRFLSSEFGLIGGGPRLPENERGAVRHDPVVTLQEEGENVSLTISQARGLTLSGHIIEINPSYPLRATFAKAELAHAAEAGVYVIVDPDSKKTVDGATDEFNPQMKTERQPSYSLSVHPQADEIPLSLAVARLRRLSLGAGFELDPAYIPACTSLTSFSELAAGWRKILQMVTALAQRYRELHRAMRDFIRLFVDRGIETEEDRDAAAFVERMALELQQLTFGILDPVQPPERFFAALRKSFHTAAIFFDFSPAIQRYYEALKETGETEFIVLVEQQRKLLEQNRSPQLNTNLAAELTTAINGFHALGRLEQALEGKYVDFHVSPTLEGMNFIFDRGGQVLFKLVAKPGRFQGAGEDVSVYFSQLRLEGRDKYRLILIGERNATFDRGYRIGVEIRINEGSGFRREPITLSYEVKDSTHRNFEFDFEAPDVAAITDLRITLLAHHPIRTALLFTRHRFYSSASNSGGPRVVDQSQRTTAVEPQAAPVGERANASGGPPSAPVVNQVQRPVPSAETARLVPSEYRGDPRIQPLRSEDPPWGKPKEPSDPPPLPARRRRLE